MANPTNHSLTGTWTATTTYAACSPAACGDGYAAVGNYLDTSSWLSSAGNVTNQSLDCNFGSAKTFDTVEVWIANWADATARPKDYEVYASDDGIDWGVALASGTFADAEKGTLITVASQTKQYVRLKMLNNYGHVTYMGYVKEIRVFTTQTDLILAATFVTSAGLTGTIGNMRDLSQLTFASGQNGVGNPIFMDFGAVYWIDSLLFFGYQGITTYHPRELLIWTSSDGILWTQFSTVSVAQPTQATGYPIWALNFPKINTRYFAIAAFRNWTAAPGYALGAVLFDELRIYEQSAPSAFSAITSLTPGVGTLTAAWTAYESAACKAYRVYIRAGSAPDAFGTGSAYFLGEFDTGEVACTIGTVADRATLLVNGTQYYVIVRVVYNDGTEDTNTTSLNNTPTASAGGGAGGSRFDPQWTS